MTINNQPNSNTTNNTTQALLFPLNVRIKLISLSNQAFIERVSGKQVAYMRQKLLKLKEEIEVFTDKDKSRLLYTIKADRVIDFSAQYNFTSVEKGLIGHTKQKGLKSLFRSEFEVYAGSQKQYMIRHNNVFAEFLEGLLTSIPFVGFFLSILSGYFLNPIYGVFDNNGVEVAQMRLKPSFFESRFELTKIQQLSKDQQELIILSLLTVIFMQAGTDDGDSGFDLF